MSRLDSFIRRLEAQRACLGLAAALVSGLDGPVLELGLGNGRTYDHLRELCPDRKIYVCERHVAAHPDCLPAPELLLLGDMRDTLRTARPRLEGRVILAHFDAASGDAAASQEFAGEVTSLIVPLLRAGAVLCSEPAMAAAELAPLALPDGVAAGRYHLYRRVSHRSSA
ncbi:MAG TPA: class I SAM-dependent methyltransferase [Stellaceae bacterium]